MCAIFYISSENKLAKKDGNIYEANNYSVGSEVGR